MIAELRRLRITEYIQQREGGVVTIAELSQLLDVSEMTVRRDLAFLEGKSILRKVHGGAVAFPSMEGDTPFTDRSIRSDPQKRIIGWLAAQLVQDGDRIILDAGTTTLQVARNLTCNNQLTVITNNIPISKELSLCPNITIILLGGMVKHIEMCTVGNMVIEMLSLLSADKYILSANGFSIRMGATETDMVETGVKQAMLRSAGEVILVADSSKFDVNSLIQIAPWKQIHKLVTDDGLPEEAVRTIETFGVEVITPSRQMIRPIPEEIKLLMDLSTMIRK
jgi:DeoR family fructose operon transcriptional repressor